jgi:hypothetical protein
MSKYSTATQHSTAHRSTAPHNTPHHMTAHPDGTHDAHIQHDILQFTVASFTLRTRVGSVGNWFSLAWHELDTPLFSLFSPFPARNDSSRVRDSSPRNRLHSWEKCLYLLCVCSAPDSQYSITITSLSSSWLSSHHVTDHETRLPHTHTHTHTIHRRNIHTTSILPAGNNT